MLMGQIEIPVMGSIVPTEVCLFRTTVSELGLRRDELECPGERVLLGP